jgi:hypothetical protein
VVFCYLVSGTSAILICPTHNSPATTNRPQEAALGHLNRFVVIAGCPSF